MPLSPSTKNLPRSVSSRKLPPVDDQEDDGDDDDFDAPAAPAAEKKETLLGRLTRLIGPELASAIVDRGFERLSPVQEAVLDPRVIDRDLRISSQTGSGKTVALGLVVRDSLTGDASGGGDGGSSEDDYEDRKTPDNKAHPYALVVVPTRELAKQVHEELAWLFAPLRIRVASVTGGGGYRDELRSFRQRPALVVGTPGRLLDHLNRKSIDASSVRAIVLDEADRMLDLGFREDIEAIFKHTPDEHRTHLVSATFPREVKALADRLQTNPLPIEGTPLGTANLDIEHLIHLVNPRERLEAIINLLLDDPRVTAPAADADPDTTPEDVERDVERGRAQSLVFARTRADVSGLSESLSEAGFNIAMLSGEMEQPERIRALAAFKRGNVDALVATDVAARGIDVQDVARVIHASPPDDADAYTHRSGRTGRAGKKGTSSVVITLSELPRVSALLSRARVRYRFAPVPSAESIREGRDLKMLAELTTNFVEGDPVDSRSLSLAERILASAEPARAVARLVSITNRSAHVEPREVIAISPPQPKAPGADRRTEYRNRNERGGGNDYAPRGNDARGSRGNDRGGDRGFDRGGGDNRGGGGDRGRPPRENRDQRGGDRGGDRNEGAGSDARWTSFRVSWGDSHGADARRLVAMMCRRGQIEGRDIGAIRIGRTSSVIDVNERVASDFEQSASKPDPRDPRVHVRRWVDDPSQRGAPREVEMPREERAPREAREERPPREAREERPPREAREIPAERPSRRAVKEVPPERPSRRSVKDVKEIPPERPSRRAVAKEDRPREAPAAAAAAAPPPRRAVVKDAPAKKPWQKKKPKWKGGGGNAPPKRR